MDEKHVINDYLSGLSSIKISKKYGCDKSKILKILRKNGIERRSNKIILTKEQKEKILDLYLKKTKIDDIVFETKIKKRIIYDVLRERGVIRNLSKKIEEETKDKICSDFLNKKTIKEIQKKYDIKSDATIYKILKQRSIYIDRVAHNKISDEIRNKIVNEYINGLNICELHEKYGYGTTTIARWVKSVNATRSFSDAFSLSANKGRKHFKGTNLPWFSTKTNKWFVADSIWEAVRMEQLDNDELVINWEKSADRIPYFDDKNESHYYIPDFKIWYKNKIVVEEIKPNDLVNNDINIIKSKAAIEYYEKQGIQYKIVTENEIGLDNIKNFKPNGLIKYTQEMRKERKRKLRNEREKLKRRNAKINNNRESVQPSA